MRWSEKETLQFVRIYLKNNFLWDAEHPDYKLRERREAAYNEIISEFRAFSGILLDTDEVKTKIKNLRSTYTQEITKIIQRGKQGTTYKPSIKWFADWHKCFKNLRCARLRINELQDADDQPLKQWESEMQDDADDQDDGSSQADPFVPEEPAEDNYIYIVKPEHQVTGIKREHPDSTKPKKKKPKRRSSLHDDFDHAQETETSQHSQQNKEDEFDIYGKYIASQLRKMDLPKALRLQLEIQSLVSEARISDSHIT